MSEDVPSKLKQLEEKTFPSEVALFDALKEAGVPGLGDYRSGSRNKNLARKNAARYVVYKKLQEIDPACTRKNALIITTVYNEPLPVEDNRGRSGKYINELKPLIVHTGKFEGTKTELFDQWEMYDQYKQKYLTSEDGSKSGRVINPWTITAFTEPGAERYYKKISFLESSTLKTALGSLESDGVLAWDNILYYTPEIGVMISSYDEDSPEWEQAKAEWTKARDSRLLTVETLSSEENCVLNPELFFAGYGDFEGYFDWYYDYDDNDGKEQTYEATQEQKQMYENYKAYIRQLTWKEYNNTDKLCQSDQIPSERDIFNDWTCRRKYNELDNSKKREMLGWRSVWKGIRFSVTDQIRTKKYRDAYKPGLSHELACIYVARMDVLMNSNSPREQIYFPENFIGDFDGLLTAQAGKKRFSMNRSKSAQEVHRRLKEFYADQEPQEQETE